MCDVKAKVGAWVDWTVESTDGINDTLSDGFDVSSKDSPFDGVFLLMVYQ